MLFYAAALVVLISGHEAVLTLGLAWAYVALRVVHTGIHTTTHDVLWRFRIFGASRLVLLALWGVLSSPP